MVVIAVTRNNRAPEIVTVSILEADELFSTVAMLQELGVAIEAVELSRT